MTRIVVERWIAARPDTVFALLTEAERWTSWQGTAAELEPRPGGVFRVVVNDSTVTSGAYVEVVRPSRVCFTWGFEIAEHPIPPGSTLVEIDLMPERDGTLVRLTHSSVPPPGLEVRRGWVDCFDRMAQVAAAATQA